MTDDTGAVTGTWDYEPYGALRTENTTSPTAQQNPMLFTGQHRDTTGLYHLRARQYDPATGGFISPDPWQRPTTMAWASPYVYTDARPGVFTDPTGLLLDDLKNAVTDGASALGGAAGDVASNVASTARGAVDTVASGADAAWDATGGKAASWTHDTCFTSWEDAATCTAAVAGTVALGTGGIALAAPALAGTAASVSTVAGGIATFAQGGLTVADCSRAIDAPCAPNAASTVLGGLGGGGGAWASRLAARGSALASPVATLGYASGLAGFGLGLPLSNRLGSASGDK